MKKVVLFILFAILQTNSFGACPDKYVYLNCSYNTDDCYGSSDCHGKTMADKCPSICGNLEGRCSGPGSWMPSEWCGVYASWSGGGGWNASVTCILNEGTQATQCGAGGGVWNPSTCQCDPPPCQVYTKCITYWNDGNGGKDPLAPNEIPAISSGYSGQGYYAMMLFEVDTCATCTDPTGCARLLMDVPGTCSEQGYCPDGQTECDGPPTGGSSSSGSSSSSYEPPECVCMGCFGGSCLVTCSDGSTRTCAGDFENCGELKNSPEWTQCTAPSSSPSGGSSSGGGGSSASPSSQQNAVDGLNALIDTLHHSNQLQEVGHGIMKDGQEQNKGFFEDARAYFAGMLKQVTGIFNNTNNINNNTNNINKNLNSIEGKLDNIANRPRDTTIVNVGGDTINIKGDTNIINIPIDSNIGRPWDTTGGMIAGFQNVFDSTINVMDTLPNWDTIHRGTTDSIGGAIVATFDSGAGKFYKDTLNGWINNGLQNSVLSGGGSNSCPAFLMSSYPVTIGSITFDLTQNVKLGQYLCQPVIGGRSGWEIGRTCLRIIVSIGCMFFLFKCATGTINEE